MPLVWFALFRQLTPVNPPNAENSPATWENSPALRWQGSVSPCAYEDAVDAIRAAIAAGEVYQVNYSFRLRAPFEGDLLPLFWQLYARQPVPYAAYLDIGAHAIASLSPELFFARAGERLWTRPMKAPRRAGEPLPTTCAAPTS